MSTENIGLYGFLFLISAPWVWVVIGMVRIDIRIQRLIKKWEAEAGDEETEVAALACRWIEDDEGNWDTGCKNLHTFFERGPAENKYQYCPYCGNRIGPIVAYVDSWDELVEDVASIER
jgi:hypothetical protein